MSVIPTLVAFILFTLWQFPYASYARLAASTGFSGRVIHVNSVESPFYNTNKTRHYQSNKGISIGARQENGCYMMEYYIGTPAPVRSYGIIDTGSDITWLQCQPCRGCNKQSVPMFDPNRSTSYLSLACDEITCKKLPDNRCSPEGLCQYDIWYADGSFSHGVLAYETLQFPGTGNWDSVVIGCGHNNRDTIIKEDEFVPPGVIGLSSSPISLVQQLPTLKRFSYCFGDPQNEQAKGYIQFGDVVFLHGRHTPLLSIWSAGGYYYLSLEGISVDDTRLLIPKDTFSFKYETSSGGFIIDSGTTYTELNTKAFNILVDQMDIKMSQKSFISSNGYDSACYHSKKSIFSISPVITFHFTGLDFQISRENTWVKDVDDVYCLAMFPTEGTSILGSYQQVNVEVGYDVDNNQLYMNPQQSCDR